MTTPEEQAIGERLAEWVLTATDRRNPTARWLVWLAVWDGVLTRALDDLNEELYDRASYLQCLVFDDDGDRIVDGRRALHNRIDALVSKMHSGFEGRSDQLLERLLDDSR